jgi:ubiquinone/menaquinone biosynthesis C-methylase UbiE/DNA-binding transcriptional ArsR family regulator
MLDAPALFRLLGDEVRLRLLRVLHAERLNVTELTSILGIAQSGVSRHLGLLKDAGLVTEQREGGFTYFRPAPPLSDARNGFGPLAAMLEVHFDHAARTEVGRADDVRLGEVRRQRKENFEAHAGPDTQARQLVPGRSWAAWARALGHLLPALKVADLGCGEGYLTIETSRWASRVLAVDRSARVLKRAQALAGRRRVRNVTWKRGELERLPIRDASVDVALLSQALHHARDPQTALSEAARIVVPGGRVLILDLREHGERWVRDRLGDRWLGFTDERLAALLEAVGLTDVMVSIGARRTGDAFTVLVASGRKPAPGDSPDTQHARAGKRPKERRNQAS